MDKRVSVALVLAVFAILRLVVRHYNEKKQPIIMPEPDPAVRALTSQVQHAFGSQPDVHWKSLESKLESDARLAFEDRSADS